MKRIVWFIFAFLLAVPLGAAETQTDVTENGKKYIVTETTIYPRAPGAVTVEHTFLLPIFEQKNENAALVYAELFADYAAYDNGRYTETVRNEDQFFEQVKELALAPEAEFSVTKAKKLLESVPTLDDVFRRADKCAYCDWNIPIYGVTAPEMAWDIRLPQFQMMRHFARLWLLKIRIAMVENRLGDALDDLAMGMRLAERLANNKTIIMELVGINGANVFDTALGQILSRPDAPNLFWTSVEWRNRPFGSDSIYTETDMAATFFPGLYYVWSKRETLPESEWQKFAAVAAERIRLWKGPICDEAEQIMEKLTSLESAADYRPMAEAWLREHGQTAETIASMSNEKCFGLAVAGETMEHWSAMRRFNALSMNDWNQVAPFIVMKPLSETADRPLAYLYSCFEASIYLFFKSKTRFVWNRDLRVFGEAISWYAAENDGRLPESMAQLRQWAKTPRESGLPQSYTKIVLPLPMLDPFTDEPYDFTYQDGAIIFELAPENSMEVYGLRRIFRKAE